MAHFHNARGVSIHGGAFSLFHGHQINYNLDDPNKVLELVASHAAPNAFYNSQHRFPPPKCHPGTRTEILSECNQWIMGRALNEGIFWIQGPLGVGKSAIMQEISEEHACTGNQLGAQLDRHVCVQYPSGEKACHRLAASFFFSRSDPTRNRLDPLVATIVYQFLKSEPLRTILGPSIIDTIRADPHIFSTSSENQFRKLILEPCSKLDPREWECLPDLVVIDGLDECMPLQSQERIIAMIQDAIPGCRLIFLIASRPEPEICRNFQQTIFSSLLRLLIVKESTESTRDIAMYLCSKFDQLRSRHRALTHVGASWPGEGVISELVNRACGQFIFAATVMAYLATDEELPEERLEAILRIRADDLPESPYPDLDLLYRQILERCRNWNMVSKILNLLVSPEFPDSPEFHLERFRNFSGKWIIPRSPKGIESLLNFQPGRVQTLLFRLHSTIEVPNNGEELRMLHASFMEYLVDPTRSKTFCVAPYTRVRHFDLVAQAFLRGIALHSQRRIAPDIIDSLEITDIDAPLFAAFIFIHELDSPSDDLLAALDQFNPYPFARWLLSWPRKNERDIYLDAWKGSVQWAQSLNNTVPRIFLERMETFLSNFLIGSPSTAISQIGHTVAYLEQMLYTTNVHQHHWCDILGHGRDFGIRRHDDIFILPASETPPPSFPLFTISRETGEIVENLLASLRDCNRESLIKDVCGGTYESVHNFGIDKEDDLYTLKILVSKHREVFGLDAYPCEPPPGRSAQHRNL